MTSSLARKELKEEAKAKERDLERTPEVEARDVAARDVDFVPFSQTLSPLIKVKSN